MTPEINNNTAPQLDVVPTATEVPKNEVEELNTLFEANIDASQQVADKLNFSQKEKRKLEKEGDLYKKRENFLVTMEDNIAKQTTLEQVSYYKKFLTVFENQISQGSIVDSRGSLVGHLPNLKDKLSLKEQEIALITAQQQQEISSKKKEEKLSAPKEITSSPAIEKSSNAEGLKAKLDMLSAKDFVEFKNVIDGLKSGKIGVEQMDPLNTMTQIIKEIAKLDKTTVLAEFDKLISEKFADKKENPELLGFKDILSGLLDKKQILQQFGETIDRDLKGLSYDQVLEQAKDPKNLESVDAKKSINTIFHMDKGGFDRLLKDFDDPTKQAQVSSMLKKYYELHGTTLPEGAVFEKSQTPLIVDKLPGQVDCFKIKGTKEVIYFGELNTGNAMNFSQVSEKTWVAEALGIDPNTKMKNMSPEVQELMKMNINTKNGPRNMRDAISALFTSPFFDQLKQAFYSLMATFGEENAQEKYAIEANYITMKSDVRKWGNFSYTDKDQIQQSSSYIEALNKFEPTIDKSKNINYKRLFIEASTAVQKSYIEACIQGGKNEGYKVLDKNVPLVEEKIEAKENTVSQESNGKEFVSGNAISELKINEKTPGKVEKKGDATNPYLTIDGQVIPLDKEGKGSVFVSQGEKIIEKTITISKDNNQKDIISVVDGKSLENITPAFTDLTAQDGKMFDLWKYTNIEQGAKANNLLQGINKIPAGDVKNNIEKMIATLKRNINLLQSSERTPAVINPLIQDTKNAITISLSSLPNKKEILPLIESRSQNII